MPKPGKQNAQKLARQAVDMAVPPPEWVYEPPPRHLCDEQVYPVPLAELVQYVYAMQVYKQRTVHFSVEVQVKDHALDDWHVVYRIDTAHGTVHEHRFRRGQAADETEQLERNELALIPREESWEFVDSWLPRALEMCEDDWSDHVERWR